MKAASAIRQNYQEIMRSSQVGYCACHRPIRDGALACATSILRNVRNFHWNHKRVYRIYRNFELNLRVEPRRRLKREKPDSLGTTTAINQVWSMDFMRPAFRSDSVDDGRQLRTFNVIDDYSREALGVDVDLSMPSERVIRSLERIIEWRGNPSAIRSDNGPKYIAQKLVDWANRNQITLIYIQPGKPTQNAYALTDPSELQHEA